MNYSGSKHKPLYDSDKLEKMVIPLVKAMNDIEGVVTIESCGGHIGEARCDRFPYVHFYIDNSDKL